MDADELVKRLRGFNPPDRTIERDRHVSVAIHEAADMIERLIAENAALRRDAERWRTFEEAGHLMITDFDRRESGVFKMTKRHAIDAAIKNGKD